MNSQSPIVSTQTDDCAPLAGDDLTSTLYWSWDAIFELDRPEVERFQLRALQRRFDELAPAVSALKAQADISGVTRIHTLDDAVPLLFDHAAYKSYPMSLIEKSRFDLLTQWFGKMTSRDLAGVNAVGCASIDSWLELLERQADLFVYHTSGTSGKLSFIPRTRAENEWWNDSFCKASAGFGDETGVELGGPAGERLPVVFPYPRHGRYAAQRTIEYIERKVAPTPDQCYTLPGKLSADIISLSGRIRMAQAKGELAKMRLSDEARQGLRDYLAAQDTATQRSADFFLKIAQELRGQRVVVLTGSTAIVPGAIAALERGLSGVFSPDSVGQVGGGNKGMSLPDNWRARIAEFTGITAWRVKYSMTEQTAGMPLCSHAHYHIPLYCIPYVLDPDSGKPLARNGVRTGRFACYDIIAQTFWGGIVSGDQVTIDWDGACGCGRKGAFLHDDIVRYSGSVTGDDKVTCSATIDNSDVSLKNLLMN